MPSHRPPNPGIAAPSTADATPTAKLLPSPVFSAAHSPGKPSKHPARHPAAYTRRTTPLASVLLSSPHRRHALSRPACHDRAAPRTTPVQRRPPPRTSQASHSDAPPSSSRSTGRVVSGRPRPPLLAGPFRRTSQAASSPGPRHLAVSAGHTPGVRRPGLCLLTASPSKRTRPPERAPQAGRRHAHSHP